MAAAQHTRIGWRVSDSADRQLVYSSEVGFVAKSSQPNPKSAKKKKQHPPAGHAIKNMAKQGVRIQRESKGRGGKNVCVISGLSLDESALKQLCKTLKAQLGTGGAIKEGNIEIQGDHRDKILTALAKQGIQAKLSGG